MNRGTELVTWLTRVALFLVVLVGLAIRIWLLVSPAGELDSDTAIVGLMAKHATEGEFSALYWGQEYGGSQESLIAALLFFLVGGPSSLVLTALAMSLNVLSTFLTWRICERSGSGLGGRLGSLLLWIWPPYYLSWAAKPGIYWFSLCATLGAIVLLLSWRQDDARAVSIERSFATGLVGGLAAWASNAQSLFFLVPFCWLLFPKLRRKPGLLAPLALGSILGAAPFLWFQARFGWPILDVPRLPGWNYFDNVSAFATKIFPMALGARVPLLDHWVLFGAGRGLYIALVALLIHGALRARRSGVVWFAALASSPIIYSAFPLAGYDNASPRYLLFLSPAICVLLGHSVADLLRRWRSLTSISILLGFTGAVLATWTFLGHLNRGSVQPAMTGLKEIIHTQDIHFAYADYWIAYRATFDLNERSIIAPTWAMRYPPYHRQIQLQTEPVPFIFLAGSQSQSNFMSLAAQLGAIVRLEKSGPWVVAFPSKSVSPYVNCTPLDLGYRMDCR